MRLSIITVCYNNKQGLIDTIESVKKQIYTDYEFIVIDGGSTDGSVDVLTENQHLFSFWVSEKDRGIYHAMNKGIEKSKGEYCLFLNSGDYLLDENVLNQVFSFNYSEDILYGNIIKIRDKRKRLITYSRNLSFLDFYKKEPAIHHQAAFIKRDLFNKYGIYREDTYMIADWIFFFETVVKYNVSTKYINEIIAVCDASGISQTYFSQDPFIIKDVELKRELMESCVPQLALKDYDTFYKGGSKWVKFKTSIKWRFSSYISLEQFVRWHRKIK
jgi:glycosyltransferase involved in cell wall biosynthesis